MRSFPVMRGFFLFFEKEVVVVAEAVRGVAVDAVEFDFLGKRGASHEAFEFGGSHVLDVHEAHVMGDHVGDVIDDLVGKLEAAEDLASHVSAEHVMAVEAVASSFFIPSLGGGFSDVVKENGEAEFEGGTGLKKAEGDFGVGVDVAFGVIFGRLLTANEGAELREKLICKSGVHDEV